jgi:hypothetical protein
MTVVEQITQKADNLVHWWIRSVVPIYETSTPWYLCEGPGLVHVLLACLKADLGTAHKNYPSLITRKAKG